MMKRLISKPFPRFLRKSSKDSSVVDIKVKKKDEDALGLFVKESCEAKRIRLKSLTPETIYEYLLKGGDLSAVIEERRSKWPDHIPHWNPKSSTHISSEEDDEHMNVKVREHNRILDDFRRDLLLQGHITEAWEEEMNRPATGIPGVHRNVYETVVDYDVKSGYEESSSLDIQNNLLEKLSNEKHINRSLFIPRVPEMSHMRDWEHEIEQQPVTSHFHASKGSKFDVETPDEKRHPHVADRLGHPEIFPRPIDSIFGLQDMHCHPNFLDLPFVQVPSPEPDAAIDFSPGEVVYYKPDNIEWGQFWLVNYMATVLMTAVIHPMHALVKTSSTFTSIIDEMPMPFYQHNINGMDYFMIMPPTAVAILMLFGGFGAKILNKITRCYISKLQFNRSRDLVFVTSLDWLGRKNEKVYETEHLEILPPSTRTATSFIDNSEKGMTALKCLNSDEIFLLHNNPKYWNKDERSDFLTGLKRLWDKSYYEYRPY